MIDLHNVDAVVACADLAGRSGARQFEVGWLHDDVPVEEAAWWASVLYRGAKLHVDDQPSPQHACDGLAHTILDGGRCTHCGRLTTTVNTEYGVYVPSSRTVNKPADKLCRWRRDGKTWRRGCER